MTRAHLWLAALLAAGCATGASDERVRFDGPGRLLLLVEHGDTRELVVLDAGRPRRFEAADVRDARFVSAEELLLILEVPAQEEFHLPDTRLALFDLASGERRPFGPRGRHYDPEPSPDGAYLAVGAETSGVGDANLEIWSLAGAPARVASRAQSLEEPRWREDGLALVASVLMADPEDDADTGGGFGGTSFLWPRLHSLRRDLGDPALLYDGKAPGTLAPGGTLPLWWDARGIYARQRDGLVRCDPASDRCRLVFSPGGTRRVVDGRPVGADSAWLLTVDAADTRGLQPPDEIVRVDLDTGRSVVQRAPAGRAIVDLDWIALPRRD